MDVLNRCGWILLLLAFTAFPNLSPATEDLQLHEQQIKAGLLYNFLKYTQWPAASFAQAPSMNVCIFGRDSFNGALKPLAGRVVNRREIALRQLRNVQEAAGCHLLFVNAGEKKQWPELRRFVVGKNILTVSDLSSFAELGGMIELGRSKNHISASLNMDATAAAGLQVEERLLRLVTVVHNTNP